MENYDIAALGKELYAINSSDKFLKEIYSNSKIVDLKEVGDMLVKVQEQIESISKSKGLVKSVIEKIPLIGKLSKNVGHEVALQQNLTDYITSTLEKFEDKHEELIQHLQNFENTKKKFQSDIAQLDEWIVKAEDLKKSINDVPSIARLDKLLTEAKSELKRKFDTIDSLISPMILAATNLTQNINELTPVLRNILYAELKTMVGVNSFKDAANMMITLKNSIVEIQKLNIINANETIVDILDNTRTNLLSNQDMEEMNRLRIEGKKKIQEKAAEINKLQKENAAYMEKQYLNLKNSGALMLEDNKEKYIEIEEIKNA